MGIKANRRLGSVADIAFGATGIADLTAPTVAEINALERIECDIAGSDTIEANRTGSRARIEGLCEIESAEITAFITNGPIQGQGFRHFANPDATPAEKLAADTFWNLMDDTALPPVTQHMVMARGGFSGAAGIAAEGDVVDVYEVQVSARGPIGPRQTTAQMFSFELSVLSVQFSVAVAA